jgi:hypothetical protein
MILVTSAAYIAGMRHGMRLCGRSLFRRVWLALFIWCLLVGSGVGFLWAAAEHFTQLVSGESIRVAIIHKWSGWHRVNKPINPKGE